MQRKLCDTGWSDVKKCHGCNKEEGTEKTQAAPLSVMEGSQRPDTRGSAQIGGKEPRRQRKNGSGKEVLRRTHQKQGNWGKCHLMEKKWECHKHKSWEIPSKCFRDHVTTDGSLMGVSGKWSACGWLVVQA